MSNCECSTQHHHNQADTATCLNTISEVLTAVPVGYMFASVISVYFDLAVDSAIGVAVPALIAGGVLSLISSAGAAYCHYRLNTNNQTNKKRCGDVENGKNYQTIVESSTKLGARNDPTASAKYSMSCWDYAALCGDVLQHTAENSQSFIFMFNLILKDHQTSDWYPGVEKGFYSVALLFGAASAYADVRTCFKAIEKYNERYSVLRTA